MKNSLGILGGLGPLATSYFYQMLTEKTKVSKDQDHLNIIILSHAEIPDRTSYILDKTKENPYDYLLKDCLTLERLGCKMITIPCNTATYFHEKLQKEINIPISNIVSNTIEFIKNQNYKSVAIMGTEGTIKLGLYQKELEKLNIKCLFPDQEKVNNLIYNYLKKGKKVSRKTFNDIIFKLNPDCFILGCTELSMLKPKLKLSDNFIDPLEIECDKILKYFNKERNY